MAEHYDSIVVGAGTAGSIVAARLAQAGQKVLLLEAGRADTNPDIHDLSGMGKLWHSEDDWDYYTVPQKHGANRRLHWPRGKVLGGSHSLNAMIWVRCAPQDFNHWESLGNPGWGWDSVLPIYQRIENFDLGTGPDGTRGTGGPLDISSTYPLQDIQRSIIDAAVQIGLEHNPDYNGASQDGIAQQQITVRGGTRLTSYIAYAKPLVGAGKLALVTGAWVHKLLFDGSKVTGLSYEKNGALHELYADEVILSAGALDSPRILMLSGIGPADHLRELGLDVKVDSKGVGENLHDHLLSANIYTTTRPIEAPKAGRSVTQTHLFWRSRPSLETPDTQPINFSIPMYEDWMTGPDSGFSLMSGLVSPKSRGRLRLASADPYERALMDPNILSEEADLLALEASLRQCREIGRAPALAGEWGAKEIYPGPDVEDDTALREYVRRTAITYHHQVGTCKMGVDEMAVVDPQLRVRGVESLRVADAAIMPQITTGNTNTPSAVIGEKAADLILG